MQAAGLRRRQDDEEIGAWNLLWSDQRIAVFRKRQDVPDADLNRRRGRDDGRPLACLAFDGLERIYADVESDTLRDQALDADSAGVLRPQQIDARTERDHLDGDLVGVVGLDQVVGDA